MPNGGMDCCWTCSFNSANQGKAGIPETPKVPVLRRAVSWMFRLFKIRRRELPAEQAYEKCEARCIIRDFVIEHPVTTYCVNHPGHNRDRIDMPIGPVYVESAPVVQGGKAYLYQREVWKPSPDTEDIRLKLVQLLETMPEIPRAEYPSSKSFDEVVIDQLKEFRERRAIPGLRRVLQFDPSASALGDPFSSDRISTIAHALEALAAIAGDEVLPEVEHGLRRGLDGLGATREYDKEKDTLARIRYYAVHSLVYCSSERAMELLAEASNDPHESVANLARTVLQDKMQNRPLVHANGASQQPIIAQRAACIHAAPLRVTELSQQRGFVARLLAEGKTLLRLSWRVFWKVTAATTAAFFLLLVVLHSEDFRALSAETLFASVVLLGYCLFCAMWVGLTAAMFAVGWRFWGAWILLPLLSALFGAGLFVALGFALLSRWEPPRAGSHGGGEILALGILAWLAVLAVTGAALGGIAGTLLAVLLARRRGRAD